MAERISRDRAEFDRGLGFFDAVYGFAITLLVANIDMPPAEAWQSLSALWASDLSAQIVGFVVSFAVIAIFWKANTDLVGRLSSMDGPVIAANLVTAALVVLIAFTTQGLSDPGISELPLPISVYAVNVAAAIVAQAVMFEVARTRGLVERPVPPRVLRAERWDTAAKILVFLVSIPIAYWVGPGWGMLTWAGLFIIAPFMGRWVGRITAAEAFEQSPGESGARFS